MTRKWLITMVIASPLTGVVGLLPNGRTSWLISGGDPNYLLSGMILQVAQQDGPRADRCKWSDMVGPYSEYLLGISPFKRPP